MPNLAWAARTAQIGRRRHYHWMEQDPDYRTIFAQVRIKVFDELMDEAVRRGRNGWLEPVFYRGVQVGTRWCYSDRLLMCVVQICKPEKDD